MTNTTDSTRNVMFFGKVYHWARNTKGRVLHRGAADKCRRVHKMGDVR